MAENQAAWGIEIGNAGLKALKLQFAPSSNQVIAVAFDYVPHAKLLSQPDAQPDELIKSAVETFLSRNALQGDLVAMSLPGKDSLVKFIQLPPVEMASMAKIVSYEAKQQIPFPLEEVYWDWQPLGVGAETSGFIVDAEVGLFAMKRDGVQNAIRPLLSRKVELELVQIAPMALYNFVAYDRLGRRVTNDLGPADEFTVILDMGCDSTDLMITNGKKIWTRNVKVGGNHFTRALTKEMKLTFAKAEHLKCNATKSPDPRAVFQAMKPVFNDYVTEVQRSIGFFASVNRSAKIARLVGVGNGFRLAGLQKFLQQNLQYEVDRIDQFNHLVGDNVLTAPLFQDNILTFAVPYGLALQALKQSEVHTTLLPSEITLKREVRKKKPIAAAAAAVMLAALALSTAGFGSVAQSVGESRFKDAEAACKDSADRATKLKGDYSAQEGIFKKNQADGNAYLAYGNSRELWLELYKSINECLPRDMGEQLDESELSKMHRISLRSITAQRTNLKTWFDGIPKTTQESYMDAADVKTPPTGMGFLFTLPATHYHRGANPLTEQGVKYAENRFLYNLWADKVVRTDPQTGETFETPVRQLGISHAVLRVEASRTRKVKFWPYGPPNKKTSTARPRFAAGSSPGAGFAPGFSQPPMSIPDPSAVVAGSDEKSNAGPVEIDRTEFVIQFVWKPTPLKDRKDPPADAYVGGHPPAKPAWKVLADEQKLGGAPAKPAGK